MNFTEFWVSLRYEYKIYFINYEYALLKYLDLNSPDLPDQKLTWDIKRKRKQKYVLFFFYNFSSYFSFLLKICLKELQISEYLRSRYLH